MVSTSSAENSIQSNTLSSRIFDLLNIIIMLFISLICLIPFLNIIAISLSSAGPIVSGKITIFPIDVTVDSYKSVIRNSSMIRAFTFTIVLTILYTAISLFMTVCAAYPLTKKSLKGREIFMILIIITMYFDGGIIPNYLLVKDLKLVDTIWALILPGMLSAYNLIILKSFFTSIGEPLQEAARIDGCSEIGILIRIILPLSKPILATLSLFYAVSRWNGLQDVLFYVNKPQLYTLQLKLREIIMMDRIADISAQEGLNTGKTVAESVKSASIIVATLPILLLYPWLQKYFISGIMIGSVKG